MSDHSLDCSALGYFADTRGQQALAQHGHPLYLQQGGTPA